MRKILVSKRRGIGDTVLMTPALEALHRNYPEAEITLLVPRSTKHLFLHQPGVRRIWCFEDQSLPSWILSIMVERFDLYLDLNSTGQTRWLARLSLARKAFSHTHDAETAARYPKRPDGIEWDLWALKECLPEIELQKQRSQVRTRIYLWQDELQHAEAYWQAKGVKHGNVVVMGTGATRPTKRWPARHFARFVDLVRERLGMSVAFLSGPEPAERRFVNDVVQMLQPQALDGDEHGVLIVDKVSDLRVLAALLAKAYAYVGNDNGPKHIAIAVGTPTLTFFGPEDPGEWHPYSLDDHPILYTPDLPCRKEDGGRWCALQECIVEKNRCLTELSPEDAFGMFLGLQRIPGVHEPAVVDTNKESHDE